MGFLRLTLHLMDSLAWPALALGYPLCASIRAIETGSKYHMRKLVTYWTIFSFISLFEHLFEKLIQWVPLWPHIKLITICWLAIPQFNGACYLYQILIHPYFLVKWHDSISQFNSSCYVYLRLLCLCLSVNLQTLTDWFNKPMEDPSLKNETFLAVAERHLAENGSDALEKLIGNKSKDYRSNHHTEEIKPTDTSDEAGRLTLNQTECVGSGPVWEDITVMEHMAKHEAAESKQVKRVKENPIQIERKTAGVQVMETVVSADAEEIKLPEITFSKKVQTEWTCAVCQMKTTSEQNLKSHLNGRKHKAKCEGLKACRQTPKSEGSSPVTKSNQHNQQVKHAAVARSEHSANEAAEPKQLKSVKENLIQIGKKPTAMQIKGTALPVDAEEIKLPETNSVKNVQTEWTCVVCQVITTSEHDLKCHLLGRRHRERLALPVDAEEIKLPETNSAKNVQTEWTCVVCQVITTSEHDLKCHLRGRRHRERREELKTCKQMARTERNPPFASNMPDKLKQEQVKHALAAQKKNNTSKKPKENVQLGATTGQHQSQMQMKNAGGATHNSKLWCRFCDVWCPDKIAMAAHLNGRKHLAKLQEESVLLVEHGF
ncbi:hypothetical protein CQW23_14576 [Capsicum baccatum]|uniref:HVA22-like protein n=1 Tax=Capsicum baccatum TaxID=33114 RepID=A0A2G2WJJ6_CAPBA|nr:hypothetical protein CQW23_14576 [Capsicum baccatum]